jgi:hypothetical protein
MVPLIPLTNSRSIGQQAALRKCSHRSQVLLKLHRELDTNCVAISERVGESA